VKSSKYFVLGGDIKKSLSEGYQLDIKALIRDAFHLTQKNFLPLFTASLLILLSLFLLTSFALNHITSFNDPIVVGSFFIFILLIVPPIVTGLLMMGVNHAVGIKSQSFDVFNYINIILKLSLSAMIVNLLLNLISLGLTAVFSHYGLVLSFVAMFYLKMSFSFAYPLMAEKKLSAALALFISFKLVNKNISQFTVLLMLSVALFILGILTSGIALLFIIPFYVNLMGIVYRQVCGVTISVTEVDDDDEQEVSQKSDFEA